MPASPVLAFTRGGGRRGHDHQQDDGQHHVQMISAVVFVAPLGRDRALGLAELEPWPIHGAEDTRMPITTQIHSAIVHLVGIARVSVTPRRHVELPRRQIAAMRRRRQGRERRRQYRECPRRCAKSPKASLRSPCDDSMEGHRHRPVGCRREAALRRPPGRRRGGRRRSEPDHRAAGIRPGKPPEVAHATDAKPANHSQRRQHGAGRGSCALLPQPGDKLPQGGRGRTPRLPGPPSGELHNRPPLPRRAAAIRAHRGSL